MGSQKKVMDVAKPEETVPDIGSKPMIVGHKSLPIDPMVKSETQNEETETSPATNDSKETIAAPSEKQKIIEPLSNEKKTASDVSAKVDQITEELEPAKNSKAGELKQSTVKEEKNNQVPDKNVKTESPEPTEAENEQKKIDPVALEMEKQDEIRKIIESKQYKVSVKQARRSNRAVTIFAFVFILLVGLSILFYLVDTSKLDIGIKLPFSLFNTQKDATPMSDSVAQLESSEVVETQPAEATAQPESSLEKVPASTYYEFTEPATWKYSRTLREETGDKLYELFTDVYTLPSGTTVTLKQNLGGKGGACDPDAGDVPYAKGNACPTFELLSREKLPISGTAFDYTTEIVHMQYADGETGEIQRFLCLSSLDPDWQVPLNEPQMGAYWPLCMDFMKSDGHQVQFSIEGIEATSETYFENEDIIEIEEVLRTFKFV